MNDDMDVPAVLDGRSNSERALAPFKPKEPAIKDAEADGVISYAKRVKDWPLLERAVDQKLEDQTEFVRWWQENVSSGHGGARRGDQVRGSAHLKLADAEDLSGISHQQVSKWAKWLRDQDKYRVRLFGAAWKAAMGQMSNDSQLVQQSLSNEHYTPAKYIDAAREVLTGIDLDPASCPEANATVKATEFYSAKDDGLRREWRGRVWLNPPYGGLTGRFITKLVESYDAGKVSAAIALVNAHCTDTSWFQHLWTGCLCFTDHRINFAGDDTRSGSTHGSAFAYFGPNEKAFVREFQRFGAVVRQVVNG